MRVNRVILIIVIVGALVPLVGYTKSVDLDDIQILNLEDFNIYDLIDELDTSSPTDDQGVPWSEDEPVPWNMTNDVIIEMFSDCREVFDGDTFRLESNDYIRLADIQAPELGEVGYAQSRNELTNLILGTKVYLDVDPIRDIYGRYVCVVYIQKDDGFINVNKYMASNGYATFWEMENMFDSSAWRYTEQVDLSYSIDAEEFTSTGAYAGDRKSNIYHEAGCTEVIKINYSHEIWFDTVAEAKAENYKPCSICFPPIVIDADRESPTRPIIYVAKDGSITFHHMWCKYVDQIEEEDKVFFNEKYMAVDSGRRSCQTCTP